MKSGTVRRLHIPIKEYVMRGPDIISGKRKANVPVLCGSEIRRTPLEYTVCDRIRYTISPPECLQGDDITYVDISYVYQISRINLRCTVWRPHFDVLVRLYTKANHVEGMEYYLDFKSTNPFGHETTRFSPDIMMATKLGDERSPASAYIKGDNGEKEIRVLWDIDTNQEPDVIKRRLNGARKRREDELGGQIPNVQCGAYYTKLNMIADDLQAWCSKKLLELFQKQRTLGFRIPGVYRKDVKSK